MGVARRVGNDMSNWIIPIYGLPIAETAVQHVTCDDMLETDISVHIIVFIGHLRNAWTIPTS